MSSGERVGSRQEIRTIVCVTGQHRQMLDRYLKL